MKTRTLTIIIAVVAISCMVAFSPSLRSVAVTDNADVYLGRIVYDLPNQVPVNTIDSNLVTKYPGMQDAILMADKEYKDYQRMCIKYDCHNTTITWPSEPTPHFQLTGDLGEAMIHDPSYKFRNNSLPNQNFTSYATYIKYENATYGILIIK